MLRDSSLGGIERAGKTDIPPNAFGAIHYHPIRGINIVSRRTMGLGKGRECSQGLPKLNSRQI